MVRHAMKQAVTIKRMSVKGVTPLSTIAAIVQIANNERRNMLPPKEQRKRVRKNIMNVLIKYDFIVSVKSQAVRIEIPFDTSKLAQEVLDSELLKEGE